MLTRILTLVKAYEAFFPAIIRFFRLIYYAKDILRDSHRRRVPFNPKKPASTYREAEMKISRLRGNVSFLYDLMTAWVRAAGASQDRSFKAAESEDGRSKFKTWRAFSILLKKFQEVCGQAKYSGALSLSGLMRRSRHLTERLPLWQLGWNIYRKLWGSWEKERIPCKWM